MHDFKRHRAHRRAPIIAGAAACCSLGFTLPVSGLAQTTEGTMAGVVLPPWSVSVEILQFTSAALLDDVRRDVLVSDPLFLAFGVRFGLLHLFYIRGSFGAGAADDDAPFTEFVCPAPFGGPVLLPTDDCEDRDSVVDAATATAELGLLLRGFIPIGYAALQIAGFAGLGYRGVWLERFIPECGDCPRQDIDVDGGYYFSPTAEVSYGVADEGGSAMVVGIRIPYEHYLSGDFDHGVGGGAFIEVVW